MLLCYPPMPKCRSLSNNNCRLVEFFYFFINFFIFLKFFTSNSDGSGKSDIGRRNCLK